MRTTFLNLGNLAAAVLLATCLLPGLTASAADQYKIIKTTQTMGTGAIDYVYADNDNRRLYIPRGNEVLVFDLDSLAAAGSITNARARGVAVDPKSQHGFCSSSPVVMWDAKDLKTLKTIEVQGRPDGIMFEPLTERIYVFSHAQPNATVIDGKDGSVVGTIDLGGAPEQAASDNQGHVYVCLEDKDNIAVVDAKQLKVTAHYDLAGKGGGPAGLGFDSKNRILFAMCHEPQTCVILSADDGKILGTVPIGRGTDGGGFNPNTMEAFSSQGDGTLTIIKEKSPTEFEAEQTLPTKPRAKTCTLDTKKNQIVLIAIEPSQASASGATPPSGGDAPPPRQRGGGPGMLDIIVVGRTDSSRSQSETTNSRWASRPTITIEKNPLAVFINGEVMRPDRLDWSPDMTLSNAVWQTGGFTDFANRSRLMIIHRDGTTEQCSYSDVRTANPFLRQGDSVVVARKNWW